MKVKTIIAAGILLFVSNTCFASFIDGESLGVFDAHIKDGGKAEQTFADLLEVDVSLVSFLGKIEIYCAYPTTITEGEFGVDIQEVHGNDAKSGTWTYSGLESANYIVLKAGRKKNGGGLEVIYFDEPGMGLWDTSNLNNKGLSYIAAFEVLSNPNVNPVPLPAAFWMMGAGLLGLFRMIARKEPDATAVKS